MTPAICNDGWIVPCFATLVSTCGPALGEGFADAPDREEHPAHSRTRQSTTAFQREQPTPRMSPGTLPLNPPLARPLSFRLVSCCRSARRLRGGALDDRFRQQ